jgi:hypothetical protein
MICRKSKDIFKRQIKALIERPDASDVPSIVGQHLHSTKRLRTLFHQNQKWQSLALQVT